MNIIAHEIYYKVEVLTKTGKVVKYKIPVSKLHMNGKRIILKWNDLECIEENNS